MKFSVLDSTRVWRDGIEVPIRPTQARVLLTLLLVAAGEPLPVADLRDLMWPDGAPSSALNLIHQQVGVLRRSFEPDLPRKATGQWLLATAGGYRMAVDADTLDLLAFRRLIARARHEACSQHIARAAHLYGEGLELWTGSVTAGLPLGLRENPLFAALERERVVAALEAADVALRGDAVAAMLPHLQRLADASPLDEAVQSRVMLMLNVLGRPGQAWQTYERTRNLLRDELGIGPGPELAAAMHQVSTVAPEPSAATDEPTAAAVFVGREREIAELRALVPAAADDDLGAPAIATISGMAGVGKTALATHVAHRVAQHFPDGRLSVDLRGFEEVEGGMDPSDALKRLLEALSLAPRDIPETVDAQAALYRSVVAGRRLLIVLDNARDAAQVRPLLPGTSGCLVLITSRNRMPDLVTREGAVAIEVDVVSSHDAYRIVADRIGADRASGEDHAIKQIIEWCGQLPLALSIIAGRAAMTPERPLSAMAAELRAGGDSLRAFDADIRAAGLRSVFAWSYRGLSPAAARMFRLMAVVPGSEIGSAAAASVAGADRREARAALAELTRSSLIEEREPGRYFRHDLLRRFSRELTKELDEPAERAAATRRVLDHHLHTAVAASAAYVTTQIPLRVPPAEPGVTLSPVADRQEALAWFKREHQVIREVIRMADRGRHDRHTWQLVWAVEYFFDRLGYWTETAELAALALAAATRSGDDLARAHAHMSAGRAANLTRRFADARTHLRHAQRLFSQAHDPTGQASVLHYLGYVAERGNRTTEALRYSLRALKLYQYLGDRLGMAMTYNSIGNLMSVLDKPRHALPYCRRALQLFQQIEDRHGEAAAWDSLGYTKHRLGHHRQAIQCFQHAVDLFREAGARHFEAVSLDHAGDSWQALGEPAAARFAWQQAVEIYTEFDQHAADDVALKLELQTSTVVPAEEGALHLAGSTDR